MKRIQLYLYVLLLLASFGMLSGCVRDDDVTQSVLQPMLFGATQQKEADSESAKSGRANNDYYIDINETFSEGQQIGVFAMHQGAIPWVGHQRHTANFMFNQPLTAGQAEENSHTVDVSYSPLRYWTNETDYFSFYCYYPWNDMTVASPTHGISFDYSSEEAQAKGLKFVVKPKPEDQIDFMVGDVIRDVRLTDIQSTGGQIKLKLHHALAMILINADCSVGEVTIESATLSGVYNTGYCLATKDDNNNNIIQWTTEGETFEYDIKDYIEERTENNTERYMLLIPQSVTEAMVITVSYRVNGGALINKTYNLNNSVNITQWQPGKYYTYNLHLSAE